jgi:hypothetical protein
MSRFANVSTHELMDEQHHTLKAVDTIIKTRKDNVEANLHAEAARLTAQIEAMHARRYEIFHELGMRAADPGHPHHYVYPFAPY